MNGQKFNLIIMLAALSLVGLVVAGGCKKSEPEGPSGSVPEVPKAAVVAGEQTICPVMGGAIDKNIFVEYKGKKVYFCCEDCKKKFEAEPEKYLAKLPQFE
jgi:YHS domain-containing protein